MHPGLDAPDMTTIMQRQAIDEGNGAGDEKGELWLC